MITIFTNVERQWRMLEKAGAALAQRRLLHSGTAVFFFNDSSVWSKEHTAALADSELAVLIWQGPIYPCGIADKALVLLTGRQAAYAFMSLADSRRNRCPGREFISRRPMPYWTRRKPIWPDWLIPGGRLSASSFRASPGSGRTRPTLTPSLTRLTGRGSTR